MDHGIIFIPKLPSSPRDHVTFVARSLMRSDLLLRSNNSGHNSYAGFLISDIHVQNKIYENFVFICRLTGKCATQKLNNLCNSSLYIISSY